MKFNQDYHRLMDKQVRVRFAPSPTGYLHVGGARTALFNWLFARRYGGRFILRVEDTDFARSSDEMVEGILRGMRWLGLDWDEGPFYQSQRLDRYRETAASLLDGGSAYRCFCGVEDIRKNYAENVNQPEHGCAALSPEASGLRAAAGEPFAVRFRVPPGKTTFTDGVM